MRIWPVEGHSCRRQLFAFCRVVHHNDLDRNVHVKWAIPDFHKDVFWHSCSNRIWGCQHFPEKTDKRALRPTMGAWICCRTSLCKLAYFDLSYTNMELNLTKTISGGFTSSCYTLEKLCNCHPVIIPFVPWCTLTISFIFKILIPLRHLKMGVTSVTVLSKMYFSFKD